MRCDVVAIGTELLLGQIIDTNSSYIGERLAANGIDSLLQVKVGDNLARMESVLRSVLADADAVVVCGGLGPTHDDITADCVAGAFGVAIGERDDALAILERRYGDELNEARRRMARIPDGGVLIANPVTDAPGFQIGNVFVMAGVPRIMKAMLEDLVPRLRTGAVVHARTLRVTGVGEGMIAAPLAEAAGASRDLSFGSYPFGAGSDGEVGTNLVVRGRDAAAVEAAVDALAATLGATGIATRRQ
jgi:molybdenum cofactor synthesis domain-containing protein